MLKTMELELQLKTFSRNYAENLLKILPCVPPAIHLCMFQSNVEMPKTMGLS